MSENDYLNPFNFFKSLNSWRLLFTLLLPIASFHVQAESVEYRIKAAFMEKITRFINWSALSSVQNDKIPFRLCVLGENPFGGELRNMASISHIKEKVTELVFLDNVNMNSRCDMLFIAQSKQHDLKSVLEQLSASPVLTVGDSPDFVNQGVMINFIYTDNRIQLEINTHTAQLAKFKISSRLLKLASTVKTQ